MKARLKSGEIVELKDTSWLDDDAFTKQQNLQILDLMRNCKNERMIYALQSHFHECEYKRLENKIRDMEIKNISELLQD
jgi:hypothetical protein